MRYSDVASFIDVGILEIYDYKKSGNPSASDHSNSPSFWDGFGEARFFGNHWDAPLQLF